MSDTPESSPSSGIPYKGGLRDKPTEAERQEMLAWPQSTLRTPPPAEPSGLQFLGPKVGYVAVSSDYESIDHNNDRSLRNISMDAAIKSGLDEVFAAHGISTTEAKREVLARVYSEPKGPSEAELLRDLPTSLQARPYRRQFDTETVRTAEQVVNRYKRGKKDGREFNEDALARVRAARRVISTTRQKNATP